MTVLSVLVLFCTMLPLMVQGNEYEKLSEATASIAEFTSDSHRMRNVIQYNESNIGKVTEYSDKIIQECAFAIEDYRIEILFVLQPEYEDRLMRKFVSALLTKQMHNVEYAMNKAFPESTISVAFMSGAEKYCIHCPVVLKARPTSTDTDLSLVMKEILDKMYGAQQDNSVTSDNQNDDSTKQLNNNEFKIVPGSMLKTLASCSTDVANAGWNPTTYQYQTDKPVLKLLVFFTDNLADTSQYDLPNCFKMNFENARKHLARPLLWFKGYVSTSALSSWVNFKDHYESKNKKKVTSGEIILLDTSIDFREFVSNITTMFNKPMCKKPHRNPTPVISSTGKKIIGYYETNGTYVPETEYINYPVSCRDYLSSQEVEFRFFYPSTVGSHMVAQLDQNLNAYFNQLRGLLTQTFRRSKLQSVAYGNSLSHNQCPKTENSGLQLIADNDYEIHKYSRHFEILRSCAKQDYGIPRSLRVSLFLTFGYPETVPTDPFKKRSSTYTPILTEEIKEDLFKTKSYLFIYTTESASGFWKDFLRRSKVSGVVIWNKYPSLIRLPDMTQFILNNLCTFRTQ